MKPLDRTMWCIGLVKVDIANATPRLSPCVDLTCLLHGKEFVQYGGLLTVKTRDEIIKHPLSFLNLVYPRPQSTDMNTEEALGLLMRQLDDDVSQCSDSQSSLVQTVEPQHTLEEVIQLAALRNTNSSDEDLFDDDPNDPDVNVSNLTRFSSDSDNEVEQVGDRAQGAIENAEVDADNDAADRDFIPVGTVERVPTTSTEPGPSSTEPGQTVQLGESRSKKRSLNPNKWARYIRKLKHARGESYVDSRGKLQPEKCVARSSHYSRNQNPNKVYLSEELNFHLMWLLYLKQYENDQYVKYTSGKKHDMKPVVKYKYYSNIFLTEFNIGFGSPRSDTCLKCDQLQQQIENVKGDEELVNQKSNERRLHQSQVDNGYTLLRRKSNEALGKNNFDMMTFDFQQNLPL
ncbi:hypothetical protein RRG08_051123 [Elysia crispata]|uniref:Uncharacterized protein n=1 Tax=Elysia crispata TaxID=231223 RepID=A0AAE1AJ13_9GAST|nr:hypothetical protein RRG08_051123 [Elysia crispata]